MIKDGIRITQRVLFTSTTATPLRRFRCTPHSWLGGILLHFFALILLMSCHYPNAYAATANASETLHLVTDEQQSESTFDPVVANKTLDKISIHLSIQDLNVSDLQQAIKELSVLQNRAELCVHDAQKSSDALAQQLDPITVKNAASSAAAVAKSTAATAAVPATSDIQYLQGKQQELQSRLSECRLFLLRSKEAITAYSDAVQNLMATELLDAKPRFWNNLSQTLSLMSQHDLHLEYISAQNSFLLLILTQYKVLSVALVLALVLGAAIGIQLNRALRKHRAKISHRRFFYVFSLALERLIVPICLSLAFVIFCTAVYFIAQPIPYLLSVSILLLVYTSALFINRLLFYPSSQEPGLLNVSSSIAHCLFERLNIFVTLCLIGLTAHWFPLEQDFPVAIENTLRTIFMTIFAINLIRIIWLVNLSQLLIHSNRSFRIIISGLFFTGLVLIIAVEWLGYHELSFFIIRALTLTLVAGLVVWALYKLMDKVLDVLSEDDRPWQTNVRSYFGFKKGQNIPELLWLRLLGFVLLCMGLFLVLLKVWALSEGQYLNFLSFIQNGFKLGGLDIIPSRVFLAVFIFTVLTLFIRYIRIQVYHSKQLKKIQGSREAFVAIVGYIGFALAFLITLVVAGVNLSSIALITGALSVGIGFGLQNIVNNFVSGIILLIERPIKYGDRIIVGDTEGTVKKISIRSTQITTSQHTDVIVPNAELISRQVTNYMFQDLHFCLNVVVDVAYGSDVHLVEKILLDVANQHADVLNNDEHTQPKVLFRAFAASSLTFELACFVNDVNRKSQVMSDLHFAIYQRFAEAKIEMAYPQCDVHIRDWPRQLTLATDAAS